MPRRKPVNPQPLKPTDKEDDATASEEGPPAEGSTTQKTSSTSSSSTPKQKGSKEPVNTSPKGGSSGKKKGRSMKTEPSNKPETKTSPQAKSSAAAGKKKGGTGKDSSPDSPPSAQRNLSLEALFQVTHSELESIKQNAPLPGEKSEEAEEEAEGRSVSPSISMQTETDFVVEEDEEDDAQPVQVIVTNPDTDTEEGGNPLGDEVAQPDGDAKASGSADDQQGAAGLSSAQNIQIQQVVRIPHNEKGIEKYQLKSDTLEEQGLKLIYTKQTYDVYEPNPISYGAYKPRSFKPGAQPQLVDAAQQTATAEVTVGRKRKHPPKPGRHICPYCGRGCAKPSVLQKHIRAHTGERPYPCVPCGFSFKTKSNLYKHCKSRAHAIKAGLTPNFEEAKNVETESEGTESSGSDNESQEDEAAESTEDSMETHEKDSAKKRRKVKDIKQEVTPQVVKESEAPVPIVSASVVHAPQVMETDQFEIQPPEVSVEEEVKSDVSESLPFVTQLLQRQPSVTQAKVYMTDRQYYDVAYVSTDSGAVKTTSPPQVSVNQSATAMIKVFNMESDSGSSGQNSQLENIGGADAQKVHEPIMSTTSSLSNKPTVSTSEPNIKVMVQPMKPEYNMPIKLGISTDVVDTSPGPAPVSSSGNPRLHIPRNFPAPDPRNMTPEMLKERITQLISANQAIVDTPMADPPRAKRLSRQNSEASLVRSDPLVTTQGTSGPNSPRVITLTSSGNLTLGGATEVSQGIVAKADPKITPGAGQSIPVSQHFLGVAEPTDNPPGSSDAFQPHLSPAPSANQIPQHSQPSSNQSSSSPSLSAIAVTTSGQVTSSQPINPLLGSQWTNQLPPLSTINSDDKEVDAEQNKMGIATSPEIRIQIKLQKPGESSSSLSPEPMIGQPGVQFPPAVSMVQSVKTLQNPEGSVIKDLLLKGRKVAPPAFVPSNYENQKELEAFVPPQLTASTMVRHGDPSIYMCASCMETFADVESLDVHQKFHCAAALPQHEQEVNVISSPPASTALATTGFPTGTTAKINKNISVLPSEPKNFPGAEGHGTDPSAPRKKGRPKGSRSKGREVWRFGEMVELQSSPPHQTISEKSLNVGVKKSPEQRVLSLTSPNSNPQSVISVGSSSPGVSGGSGSPPTGGVHPGMIIGGVAVPPHGSISRTPVIVAHLRPQVSLPVGVSLPAGTVVLGKPGTALSLQHISPLSLQPQVIGSPSSAVSTPAGTPQTPQVSSGTESPATPATPETSNIQSLWKQKLKGKLLMRRSMSVERERAAAAEANKMAASPAVTPEVRAAADVPFRTETRDHSEGGPLKKRRIEDLREVTSSTRVVPITRSNSEPGHRAMNVIPATTTSLKSLEELSRSPMKVSAQRDLGLVARDGSELVSSKKLEGTQCAAEQAQASKGTSSSDAAVSFTSQPLLNMGLMVGGNVKLGVISVQSATSASVQLGIPSFSSSSPSSASASDMQIPALHLKVPDSALGGVGSNKLALSPLKSPAPSGYPLTIEESTCPVQRVGTITKNPALDLLALKPPSQILQKKPERSQTAILLHGHDYASMRSHTHVTFCCVLQPQPMYVTQGNNRKTSMYSNWRVAPHNPNPIGLSTQMMLAVYRNPKRSLSSTYSQCAISNPRIGVLTHSSYWNVDPKKNVPPISSYQIPVPAMEVTEPDKQDVTQIIEVATAEEIEIADMEKRVQIVEAARDIREKVREPRRVKIFAGGFKSNEEYIYVRGRGRGKYVCEECGIRCKKPSMLKKHIRTHTDVRPYLCKHCNFSFKTKGNLTKHMKSKAHHKKCLELGVNPIPITVDESQIDAEALARQALIAKQSRIREDDDDEMDASFADDESEDDDDMDDDDEEYDEEEDEEYDEEERLMVIDESPNGTPRYRKVSTNEDLPVYVAMQHPDGSQPTLARISTQGKALVEEISPQRYSTVYGLQQDHSTSGGLAVAGEGSDKDDKHDQSRSAIDDEVALSLLDLSKRSAEPPPHLLRQQSAPPSIDGQKGKDGNRLDTLIGALMSRTKNPESQESPEDGATQGEEGERKGENLEGAKGPSRRRAESESQGSSVGKLPHEGVHHGDGINKLDLHLPPQTASKIAGLQGTDLSDLHLNISQSPLSVTGSGFVPPVLLMSGETNSAEDSSQGVPCSAADTLLLRAVPSSISGPIVGQLIKPDGKLLPSLSETAPNKAASAPVFQFSHPFSSSPHEKGGSKRHASEGTPEKRGGEGGEIAKGVAKSSRASLVLNLVDSEEGSKNKGNVGTMALVCSPGGVGGSPALPPIGEPQVLTVENTAGLTSPQETGKRMPEMVRIGGQLHVRPATPSDQPVNLSLRPGQGEPPEGVVGARKRSESGSSDSNTALNLTMEKPASTPSVGTPETPNTPTEQLPKITIQVGGQTTPQQIVIPMSPVGQRSLPSSTQASTSHQAQHSVHYMTGEKHAPFEIMPIPGRVNDNSDSLVDGKYVCNVCNKTFSKQHQLTLHKNIHYFERPFRCEDCGISFRTRGHLLKHQRSDSHTAKQSINIQFGAVTTNNPRPFKCEDCNIAFRIHGHLAKHLRSKMHVTMLEKLGKVPVGTYIQIEKRIDELADLDAIDCESSLLTIRQMVEEVNNGNNTSKPTTTTTTTTITTTTTSSKTMQQEDSSLRTSVSVMSPVATTTASVLVRTISHSDLRSDESDTEVTSPLKEFHMHQVGEYEHDPTASNENVTVEIKQEPIDIGELYPMVRYGAEGDNEKYSDSDSDIAARTCNVCQKVFRNASYVQTHIRSQHTDIKEYRCPHPGCGKEYANKESFKYHIGSHAIEHATQQSSVGGATEPEKLPKCSICNKVFKKIATWKQHLVSHAELRPYVCEYCDAGFTTAQSLKFHLRTHTQERPYICGQCGDTFARSDHLKQHNKTHAKPTKTGKEGSTEAGDQTEDAAQNTTNISGAQTLTTMPPSGQNTGSLPAKSLTSTAVSHSANVIVTSIPAAGQSSNILASAAQSARIFAATQNPSSTIGPSFRPAVAQSTVITGGQGSIVGVSQSSVSSIKGANLTVASLGSSSSMFGAGQSSSVNRTVSAPSRQEEPDISIVNFVDNLPVMSRAKTMTTASPSSSLFLSKQVTNQKPPNVNIAQLSGQVAKGHTVPRPLGLIRGASPFFPSKVFNQNASLVGENRFPIVSTIQSTAVLRIPEMQPPGGIHPVAVPTGTQAENISKALQAVSRSVDISRTFQGHVHINEKSSPVGAQQSTYRFPMATVAMHDSQLTNQERHAGSSSTGPVLGNSGTEHV